MELKLLLVKQTSLDLTPGRFQCIRPRSRIDYSPMAANGHLVKPEEMSSGSGDCERDRKIDLKCHERQGPKMPSNVKLSSSLNMGVPEFQT